MISFELHSPHTKQYLSLIANEIDEDGNETITVWMSDDDMSMSFGGRFYTDEFKRIAKIFLREVESKERGM